MNVLVPLLDGFEEIEFVSIVDILRRAGVNAIIAGEKNEVIGAHEIAIKTQCKISEVDAQNLDAIVLAGGFNGMMNLCNNNQVIQIIQNLNNQNKLVAAVCASPIVLGKAGALKNKFVCYPGCETSIKSSAKLSDEVVCVDGNIITSIGPASAGLFALEVVKYLCGKEKYEEVYGQILQGRI